jgi:integrase
MNAWLFQDTRQKAKLGDKCPWSVGWYDADGRKRSKKIGSKSMAEKYRKQIEAKLALGIVTGKTRAKWADFRKQFAAVVLESAANGTANAYESALNAFQRIVKPVYMDSINTASIDTFKAKRSKEAACAPIRMKVRPGEVAKPKIAKLKPRKVSPATVNKELRHLRAALRKAWRWELIAQPPEVTMLRELQHDPYFIDDEAFKALYDACGSMMRPADRRYPAADWWRALLCFAYFTGWRIGEILDLRREDLDLATGIAKVDANSTKGRREARVELHPIAIDHVRPIIEFQPFVFDWPHHERTLWTDFENLKSAAVLTFKGAFHRFRFGFANANVDHLDPQLLQTLMRHKSSATTRQYINVAERLKRSGIAERLHVPEFLQRASG